MIKLTRKFDSMSDELKKNTLWVHELFVYDLINFSFDQSQIAFSYVLNPFLREVKWIMIPKIFVKAFESPARFRKTKSAWL